MKIVSDHGWPIVSDGSDASAFDAFKNERDYLAQGAKMKTTVAAMDWAAREIERLRAALKPFAELSPMHDDITTPPMVEAARRALGLHKNGDQS